MANITLSAGTLPPPSCYANDQERLESYVAAIIAEISGGVQWEAQSSAPSDLTEYWLQTDANGRPVHLRKYSVADAKWSPILDVPFVATVVGGTGNDITISSTPTFNTTSLFQNGRRIVLNSPGANTGAVTLTVDGLASKPLVKQGGDPLEAGDLLKDQIVDAIYNAAGDWWEMTTPPRSFILTASAISGLIQSGTATMCSEGSSTSIPHGMSSIPKISFVRAKCITAQAGFSKDDEVDFNQFAVNLENSAVGAALSWSVDSSGFTITRMQHTGVGVTAVMKKTGGGWVSGKYETLTDANWGFIAYWMP
jgi:hypothetical protein